MRKNARKILFEELEKSGWQWAVFNEEEPNKNNGMVECILDAMEKYKKADNSLVKKNVDSGQSLVKKNVDSDLKDPGLKRLMESARKLSKKYFTGRDQASHQIYIVVGRHLKLKEDFLVTTISQFKNQLIAAYEMCKKNGSGTIIIEQYYCGTYTGSVDSEQFQF